MYALLCCYHKVGDYLYLGPVEDEVGVPLAQSPAEGFGIYLAKGLGEELSSHQEPIYHTSYKILFNKKHVHLYSMSKGLRYK